MSRSASPANAPVVHPISDLLRYSEDPKNPPEGRPWLPRYMSGPGHFHGDLEPIPPPSAATESEPGLFASVGDHPQLVVMRSSRILQNEFTQLLVEGAGASPSRLAQL